MDDRLGQDTNEAIQELCKKISVAHNLDVEIQEELQGHMEDKLIAYLNGEEELDEKDAFILVREHFGEPAVVKGLLRDVHAYEAQVSFGRRISAALITSTIVMCFCFGITRMVLQAWPAARGIGGFSITNSMATIAVLGVSWLLLWNWQRRLDAGHSTWFLSWRPTGIVTMAVCSLVACSISMAASRSMYDGTAPTTLTSWIPFVNIVLISFPSLLCILCLWWSDRLPRKAGTIRNTAGLYGLWMWLLVTIPNRPTSWPSRLSPLPDFLWELSINLLGMVVMAVIACLLYVMGRRVLQSAKSGWLAKEVV